MTEREELYCQSVAQGLGPATSVNAAGLDYTPRSQEVKARIQKLQSENAENNGITKNTVLSGFQEAIANSETAMEQISGWREIGKMLGFYEPKKININVSTGAVGHLSNERLIELADMSDVIDGEYHLVDE